MRRLVLCALLALAACGDTQTPTNPTPTIVTDTFANATPLGPNGAFAHSFTTATSGPVVATLTTVKPDATKVIGFQMGLWTASTSTCSAIQSNDAAIQGAQFAANATSAGSYCVRLYDVGTVKADAPVTYTVTVTHP
jgi:hypothetical protein